MCIENGTRQKVSFKEILFNKDENPGIKLIENGCIWALNNLPDISMLSGWKLAGLAFFGYAYALALLAWLLQEGVTFWGIAVRTFFMMLLFGVIYSHMIAGGILAFMHKWKSLSNS